MVATFRLETKGGHEIEAKLADLISVFGDLTPLMQDFGGYIEDETRHRFETETAPDGSAWLPSRRVLIDGGKTLTGPGGEHSMGAHLRQNISHQATPDSVMVGSNLIYAGVHQFGATIRAKTAKGLMFKLPGGLGFRRVMQVEIPARPFLGLSHDDEAELLALAEDYAVAAMGGAA